MKAVILAVLLDGPRHGYAIAKAVREGSEGALKLGEGQLYPALYALEEQGWVTAEWEEAEGEQPRRIYRITDSGRTELASRAKRWHDFTRGVANLLPIEPEPAP
jgi:DNA-binding PadR family transcriptional regulator